MVAGARQMFQFFRCVRAVLTESVQNIAASKLYKNKLVILNEASFYVNMSPRLLS